MPFPAEFYYQETQSTTHYTREPTGHFDVNRMIAGAPAWVMPSLPRVAKPKKIILADWTVPFWSDDKKDKMQAVLTELLAEGFSVSAWQAGKAVPITQNNLIKSLEGLQPNPAFPDEILQAVGLQRISLDQVHVLDDYGVGQLCHPDEPAGRLLTVSNYLRLTTERDKKKVLALISQLKPALTQIVHDVFSTEANECLAFLKSQFTHSEIRTHYREIKCDADSLIRLATLLEDPAKGLEVACATLTLDQLKQIECFDYSSDQYVKEGENLSRILAVAVKLKKIRVAGSLSFKGLQALAQNSLPQLETIDLSGCLIYSFEQENVMALLATAPNLTRINFPQNFGQIAGFFALFAGKLPQFKKIEFRNSTIGAEYFNAFFTAMPNLEQLTLIYFGKRASTSMDRLILTPNSLPRLHEIDLSCGAIDSEDLNLLLVAASNLRKVKLFDCEIEGKLSLVPNSLLQLEAMDLGGSKRGECTISVQNLSELLAAAPNLKEISLPSDYSQIERFFAHFNGQLQQFEKIKLTGSDLSNTIPAEYLNAFFIPGSNLQELTLYNFHTIASELVFPPNGFLKLNKIYLNVRTLDARNLSRLFAAAENLQKVTLVGGKITEGKLDLAPASLLQLEWIHLGCFISVDNLIVLLTAAPNVMKVYFYRIEGDLAYLEAFLAEAPNLKNRAYLQQQVAKAIHAQNKGIDRSSIQTRADIMPVAPPHYFQEMKTFKPTPTDQAFKFSSLNRVANQYMVINKLSQYLTLTGQHLDVIPKIQDGLCNTLAHFYKDIGRAKLHVFLTTALAWDGSSERIGEIAALFDEFYLHVVDYQLGGRNLLRQFLGNHLEEFLGNLPPQTQVILNNPWHAIGIRKLDEATYELYDPESSGVKSVDSSEILSAITHSLGHLVGVESDNSRLEAGVDDFGRFIEEGGLLSLCRYHNIDQLLKQAQFLDATCSKKALEGLLLRSMNGIPAWVGGLQHHNAQIKQLSLRLLAQFRALHADADMQLQVSLTGIPLSMRKELTTQIIQSTTQNSASAEADQLREAMPRSLMRQELTTQVIQSTPRDSASAEAVQLREAMRVLCRSSNQARYPQLLSTWESQASTITSVKAYCQEAVGLIANHQTRLIEFDSSQALNGLCHALQVHCRSTQRPVFYIDKPEDLICSAPFIARGAGHVGELRQGPGGPLYDFLQAHQHDSPVLLVNYEQFTAADIVRFNSLLDAVPNVDGIPLPAQTTVIGLLNKSHPNCYRGADFHSRFNVKTRNPFTSDKLALSLPPILPAPDDDSSKVVINLYHAPDWESRLLGGWVMHGRQFIFEEGALQQALASGYPIEIQNGLWGDKDFERFWQQIRQGGVRYAGQTFLLPESTVIYSREGYDWGNLSQALETKQGLESGLPVLNRASLPQFFSRYHCNDDKTLTTGPGLIAASHGTLLSINVTATLDEDTWAMVLAACGQYGVRLKACCVPGVALPPALRHEPGNIPAALIEALENRPSFDVIASTDIDTTVAMLTKTSLDWQVIDVSSCQPHDLLTRLDGGLNPDTLQLEFTQTNCALLRALHEKKNVILKGTFSPALVDALTPLLIQIECAKEASCLKLVTDDASPFSFLQYRSRHEVSDDDKLVFLPAQLHEALTPYLAEPLSKLRARAAFLQLNPGANSDEAWVGMAHLPGGVELACEPLDVTTSAAQAQAFTEQRKTAVLKVLDKSPCVFLSGLSGVGKTTFVQQELGADGRHQLFDGESCIKAWALDKGAHVSLLFLDEANLSHRNWSEFEGLFETPPGMVIDGQFYPLTPNHKVVFAGNPVSYGDERQLAPFFQRHGAAVLFNALPSAVIYEKILKPLFEGQVPEREQSALCQPILDAYAQICASSTTDMLISPRELQMMVLMALSNYQQNPTIPLDVHLTQAVYDIGKSLIPDSLPQACLDFEQRFKPHRMPSAAAASMLGDEFLVTSSREFIVQQLQARLHLRDWRRAHQADLNEAQRYGGLGGLILEGAPGVGKSELVIHALLAEGYEEEHDIVHPTAKQKPFYRMPVSMGLAEKKALLSKAFDEGAIVIIDEINSSPMMEQFLNALLMGRNPDKDNRRPMTPGFMVIGTQNPISMAGRRAASTALSRRMTTITLPDYTPQEMEDIIVKQLHCRLAAHDMVEVYLERKQYAKAHGLEPEPCFRDLLTLAINTGPVTTAPASEPNRQVLISRLEEGRSRTGFFSSRLRPEECQQSPSNQPAFEQKNLKFNELRPVVAPQQASFFSASAKRKVEEETTASKKRRIDVSRPRKRKKSNEPREPGI